MPNIPFAILAALMRLGHKYGLTDIMNGAAGHLEECFTTDLDIWLKHRSLDRLGIRPPHLRVFSRRGRGRRLRVREPRALDGQNRDAPHHVLHVLPTWD